MTKEEARALGIPDGMYPAFQHMSADEAKTQRCDCCDKVMAVYVDARWRFQMHVIRCVPCQHKAEARGDNVFEAMFVS